MLGGPAPIVPEPVDPGAERFIELQFSILSHAPRIWPLRPIVLRHAVLTRWDELSNTVRMIENTLTWRTVDDVAAELGVKDYARAKWRQAGRGVPAEWRIKITQALLARGVPVALSNFDLLPENPGRIAA